jgi:NAD+ kinase
VTVSVVAAFTLRAMQRFTFGSDPRATAIGVIVAPTSDCGPQILMLEAWADAQGVEVLDLGTSAQPSGFRPGCGLIVALGGDGTILRALQLAMPHQVAVLGINFGTVGFLADRQRDELQRALDVIAAGEAMTDERTALVATLGTDLPSTVVAFNDVVVARRPGFGTARLRVDVCGETVLALRGDGVVLASPTGSTAYNAGAGGPAVAPTLDAIVVTPLATQGSRLRSLVLDGSDTVAIAPLPASAPLRAEIDGRTVFDVPEPGVVEVCAAPHKARLVRTRPRTFHHDLVRGL